MIKSITVPRLHGTRVNLCRGGGWKSRAGSVDSAHSLSQGLSSDRRGERAASVTSRWVPIRGGRAGADLVDEMMHSYQYLLESTLLMERSHPLDLSEGITLSIDSSTDLLTWGTTRLAASRSCASRFRHLDRLQSI